MLQNAPARLRRIVAASDLSENSDLGIESAARLASAAGAEWHVFHAIPPPVFPYWDGLIPDGTREAWLQSARTDLEWQVRRVLGEDAIMPSLEVRLGEPAGKIVSFAEEVGSDLIVVGPHQPRAAFDDLLGSIGDRLMRMAGVPCLVANKAIASPLLQVLFPVDFSPTSNHCVRVGMELLAESLLARGASEEPSVVEILFVSAFATAQPRPIAVEPQLARQLEVARACLPADHKVKLLPRILSAPLPVDGIRTSAERMEADLIVLGTHGFGTLGRALVGSVASSVARTIPYSVLLVPPP
jgi:nucleotide-binding universal stress UspA family protein